MLAPQCWTEGVIIISPSPETHCCLLCCEVRLEKSVHIYVGADWIVGHSIRGKKRAVTQRKLTLVLGTLFGAVTHIKHTLCVHYLEQFIENTP
jgi:hypothetical protein